MGCGIGVSGAGWKAFIEGRNVRAERRHGADGPEVWLANHVHIQLCVHQLDMGWG